MNHWTAAPITFYALLTMPYRGKKRVFCFPIAAKCVEEDAYTEAGGGRGKGTSEHCRAKGISGPVRGRSCEECAKHHGSQHRYASQRKDVGFAINNHNPIDQIA